MSENSFIDKCNLNSLRHAICDYCRFLKVVVCSNINGFHTTFFFATQNFSIIEDICREAFYFDTKFYSIIFVIFSFRLLSWKRYQSLHTERLPEKIMRDPGSGVDFDDDDFDMVDTHVAVHSV